MLSTFVMGVKEHNIIVILNQDLIPTIIYVMIFRILM